MCTGNGQEGLLRRSLSHLSERMPPSPFLAGWLRPTRSMNPWTNDEEDLSAGSRGSSRDNDMSIGSSSRGDFSLGSPSRSGAGGGSCCKLRGGSSALAALRSTSSFPLASESDSLDASLHDASAKHRGGSAALLALASSAALADLCGARRSGSFSSDARGRVPDDDERAAEMPPADVKRPKAYNPEDDTSASGVHGPGAKGVDKGCQMRCHGEGSPSPGPRAARPKASLRSGRKLLVCDSARSSEETPRSGQDIRPEPGTSAAEASST